MASDLTANTGTLLNTSLGLLEKNISTLQSPPTLIAAIASLAGFIWLSVLLTGRFSRSYGLLRRFHAHDKFGGPLAVWRALFWTYVHSVDLGQRKNLIPLQIYEQVRRRIEYSIFHPRPAIPHPPHPNTPDWAAGLSTVLRATEPETEVNTAKDVADAEDLISRYFEAANNQLGFLDVLCGVAIPAAFTLIVAGLVLFLQSILSHRLGAPAREQNGPLAYIFLFCIAAFFGLMTSLVIALWSRRSKPPTVTKFLVKVVVRDGFFAPLHLIAGLLNRVHDEWSKIIEVYNHDIDQERSLAQGDDWRNALRKLRTIQKFTFDCWLLWGPSIPICSPKCGKHRGGLASFQLGYGDENSSVEIIGSRDFIDTCLTRLDACRRGTELAVNVETRGWISHSNVYADKDRIGLATRQSWRADSNGRVLLLMYNCDEAGSIEPKTTASFYYTAYLWGCFVITKKKGQEWVPVHSKKDGVTSIQPWLDFIPFFEHANIADDSTYRFSKEQLVRKSLDGLARLVEEWSADNPGKAYPLKFSYACAVDDSGCQGTVEFPKTEEGSTLRALFGKMIGEYPALIDVVTFAAHSVGSNAHPSCEMPTMIGSFYEHISEVGRDTDPV